MILAGIDEAGYGPVLGPLITASAAVRVAGDAVSAVTAAGGEGGAAGLGVPDVWKMLSPVVSRVRDRSGRKLHIGDSKAVYSPSAGVGGLERGVLAFAAAGGMAVDSLEGLIGGLDPQAMGHLRRHAWYGVETPFPMEVSMASVGPTANGLRAAMAAGGVELPVNALAARVIPEGRYNDLVRQTRNKASVLFMHVAQLIQGLLTAAATEPGGLLLVCDRQGGREQYGEPLRTMFPEYRLAILEESAGVATYQLERGGSVAVVSFREKGEGVCLPTGLASMVCKYLRESLMGRFNAYFAAEDATLKPTAGYYTDGMRFLADSEAVRKRLGIVDGELIRER